MHAEYKIFSLPTLDQRPWITYSESPTLDCSLPTLYVPDPPWTAVIYIVDLRLPAIVEGPLLCIATVVPTLDCTPWIAPLKLCGIQPRQQPC